MFDQNMCVFLNLQNCKLDLDVKELVWKRDQCAGTDLKNAFSKPVFLSVFLFLNCQMYVYLLSLMLKPAKEYRNPFWIVAFISKGVTSKL